MNKTIITSFWAVLVFFILFSNNPSYPILSHNTKKAFSYLFPQGWGFFTKDPKEVTIDVYQMEKKNMKLVTINNFSSQNLFGLSREARYIGYELGKLEQYIPKKAYVNKLGFVGKTYPGISTVVKIPFIPKFYSLDKEYVIFQYKIVPFSWINKNQEQYKPYLVAKIKFEYSPSASYNPKKYFEKNR
ncbi:antimicrobial peptide system SdpA family protein [Flavobacterium sp. 90]|uniref:SdpA family antimicrobial peptide system protein n=1 Tax=unclassified Flavobacterium TaxID=196869 RepID=UPI000EB5295E|nr:MULTISPECIES: SdpA family antimicrobial peptide system protein [unclassified Flavobacterium]RKR05125.1 antimicrobial peptide system SdpA family protein [Flavobacterium sp. 81]TCK56440.1 antimicrobial peptide system SdpA family protein [Flavobacterium sp. 90]